ARAFLRGSDLILLDEPTSNVDSINEGIILKALKQQKQNKCIILVSHRESTMAVADRVYRVEGGRIYEC
ncbi:MAG: ABC transporter ATP-binding protein, partial [Oscillospiraceae bacterium]|nr:ABC transporter ATP-binding protein [Oscillospiraceae bacterium]